MPTLGRILKYMPAIVLGLLVMTWGFSTFWRLTWMMNPIPGTPMVRFVTCSEGRIVVAWVDGRTVQRGSQNVHVTYATSLRNPLGILRFKPYIVSIPFVFLVTLFSPLAIGPFLAFRFRLWHYLAFTALVAVELAYYLRWQS